MAETDKAGNGYILVAFLFLLLGVLGAIGAMQTLSDLGEPDVFDYVGAAGGGGGAFFIAGMVAGIGASIVRR